MKIPSVIVDTSSVAGGSRVLQRLAEVLSGAYRHARDLHARQLYAIVGKLD